MSASLTKSSPEKTTSLHPIHIDVGTTTSSSQKISNFLGIQGIPFTFNRSKLDPWGVEAWRELGLSISEVCLFSEDNGTFFGDNYSICVTRNSHNKLELDYSNLEAQLNYLTKTLGARQVNFAISHMPKALSSNPDSPYYMFYTPANYQEWEEIISRAVLHLKDNLGFAGAHYQVWSEPDSYCCFRGRPERKEMDPGILDDYIELYAWSYKAVKKADPSAKVGGPMCAVYSSEICRSFGHPWAGVDNHVQKIAKYNQEHPNEKIAFDEVVWQDYDWFNDGRIAEGVKHIRNVLTTNGFSQDTPQYLVGWNTGYSENNTKMLPQRAAYIAAMIVEQLNLGDKGLDRAYLWPFDYDYQFPNVALVTIPCPEKKMGGEKGSPEWAFFGDQTFPAVTHYSKRPAYAGLQMLAVMKEGQFLKITTHKLPKGIQCIATRHENEVICLVVNNSDSTHQFELQFSNLPYTSGSVTSLLKRIDQTHSNDGKGLEPGKESSLEVKSGKLAFPLEMPPYSIAQIKNTFTK